MNPFLLFAGDTYYPGGGWEDFKGAYESKEQAIEAFARIAQGSLEWAHIVDLTTNKIVWTK